MPATRPNPWQVSHAPRGELNEKSAGTGSVNRRPQTSQTRPRKKRRAEESQTLSAPQNEKLAVAEIECH